MLSFDVLTLFPSMLEGIVSESMLGRAVKNQFIDVQFHNIRNWATDKHNLTDDRPFGGGAGMVMKPEPLFEAIESLKREKTTTLYLSPDGIPLSSALSRDLATQEHLILLSGHYEGVDQRVRDHAVDLEVSIGDYILTNGTLAAGVLIDSVSRFVPGVLGEEKSLTQDAFNDNLLSFPQYTRPAVFRGYDVPEVLLSGDHKMIDGWRKEQQIIKTKKLRPDLIENRDKSQ